MKIQIQRVGRKTEVNYASDDLIPKDPDPPTQLSSALQDQQFGTTIPIPWTDLGGATPVVGREGEDIQAGLSSLPSYVRHLSERELGILVEKLSEPRYNYLLQVSLCFLNSLTVTVIFRIHHIQISFVW